MRNAALLSGDERHGDLPGLAGKRGPNAVIDGDAQPIDGGPGGDIPRGLASVFCELDLAGGVAGSTQAREPGLAGEVEPTWLDGLRWRLKRRLKRDDGSRLVDKVTLGG